MRIPLALAVFFALVTAFTIALHRTLPPVDALAALDSIHVGAPPSALAGFQCQSVAVYDDVNFCERQLGGLRHTAYVTLYGGVVRSVSLSLGGARIAELERRYGRAASRSTRRSAYGMLFKLCYGEGHTRAVIVVRPYGTSTHVSLVSDDVNLC